MVYMYHSFLIHSSADGHLGCFCVLAIINSAYAVDLNQECTSEPKNFSSKILKQEFSYASETQIPLKNSHNIE